MEEINDSDLELEINSSTRLENNDFNSYRNFEYGYDPESYSVNEYGPQSEPSSDFNSINYSDYVFDSDSDEELPDLDLEPKFDIEKVIQSLPTILIDLKRLSENKECTICYENFEWHKYAKKLLCGHFYHETCIKCWLEKGKTCPYCRKNVY